MRDERSVSLGGDERGQTVQDFAVGASIFLLTTSFTFAFVPSLFTPFATEVPPGSASQADRVATSLVDETSEPGQTNNLSAPAVQNSLAGTTEDDLKERYSLPLGADVNVTIVPVNSTVGTAPVEVLGDTIAVGPTYRDQPAASITRVVVIHNGPSECDPDEGNACRLIVRVW